MASVLINADDFGLTDGVCRSIAALFDCGGISNTSVMICVEKAAQRIKNHLPADVRCFVGVHLQITPENHHRTPISPPQEIPTLVDGSGRFKPTGHIDWINPAEVELEWERQIIATAAALGASPSHLDSHHGVHRIPALMPIYLKLARKYGLAARGGRTPKQIDGAPYGVHTSDICTSDWTGQNGTVETFQQMVREKLPLAEGGILEICTHPGFFDEELLSSSSWNKVREADYKVLRSLAEQRWFELQGINIARFQKA
jgi:predicted glycoside hydrolase/deacetylase ChbG (UPF0249 family)